MDAGHHALKVALLAFWALWFAVVFATDLCGGLKAWGGLQTDVQALGGLHLTLFAGTRRKGKVCAGGICVQRPPLSGVEGTVRYRF